MKELYTEVAQRLSLIPAHYNEQETHNLSHASYLDGKPSLLQWIDRYYAQPEFLDQGLSFNLPAAFVEIAEVRWESLGKGLQKGRAILRIHILSDTLADSYQGSDNQAQALLIYDTLRAVHKNLQGFTGGSDCFKFSPLSRTSNISDTRHDTVSVDIIEYETQLTDASAQGDSRYKQLGLMVDPNIDNVPPTQTTSQANNTQTLDPSGFVIPF